ncbi:hypothetical protein IKG10_02490 [Candidatus Saccharibacteria bacterium]|nr:hypothetical protein [Candidatus Saccharibacteria bacterium]
MSNRERFVWSVGEPGVADKRESRGGFDSLASVPFIGEQPTLLSKTFSEDTKWEIPGICRQYTNEISFNKLRAWDVLEANRHDYRRGAEELRDWLADMFQIEPPRLEFRLTRNLDFLGEYDPDKNIIVVVRDAGRDREGDLNDLNTVAHEMWHAWQYHVVSSGGERSDIYSFNDRHYCPSEEDEKMYEGQIMEREAFYFGKTVERYFGNYLKEGQDVVTAFLRTFGKKKAA